MIYSLILMIIPAFFELLVENINKCHFYYMFCNIQKLIFIFKIVIQGIYASISHLVVFFFKKKKKKERDIIVGVPFIFIKRKNY